MAAVGAGEDQLLIGVALERPAAFVNEVVMRPAQPDEVPAVRGTVVALPELDVVDLADLAATAWEAAVVLVAALDATAEPAGRVVLCSADAHAGAVGAFHVELDG